MRNDSLTRKANCVECGAEFDQNIVGRPASRCHVCRGLAAPVRYESDGGMSPWRRGSACVSNRTRQRKAAREKHVAAEAPAPVGVPVRRVCDKCENSTREGCSMRVKPSALCPWWIPACILDRNEREVVEGDMVRSLSTKAICMVRHIDELGVTLVHCGSKSRRPRKNARPMCVSKSSMRMNWELCEQHRELEVE